MFSVSWIATNTLDCGIFHFIIFEVPSQTCTLNVHFKHLKNVDALKNSSLKVLPIGFHFEFQEKCILFSWLTN